MFFRIIHIVIIFLCSCSYGQFVYTKQYTIDDGLLSNGITALYQDSRGLLWIGSDAGLLVKTMDQFLGIVEVNQNRFNDITAIIEDQQNYIWISSASHGVMRLDGKDGSKIFNKKNGLVSERVQTLFSYKNYIYVGTKKGISCINTQTLEISNPKLPNNPDLVFEIRYFFEYENKIYASTTNNGVFSIDESNQKLSINHRFSHIETVIPYYNNLLYNIDDFYFNYNTTSKEVTKVSPYNKMVAYAVKNKNTLYFVTTDSYENLGGLYQLHQSEITNISNIFGIPYTDLLSIVLDQQNNTLYLGTNSNGLLEVVLDNPLKKIFIEEAVHTLANANEQMYVFTAHDLQILNTADELIYKISSECFYEVYRKNYHSSVNKIKADKRVQLVNPHITFDKISFYKSILHKDVLWVSSNIGFFKLSLQGDILEYYPMYLHDFDFYYDQLVEVSQSGGVRIYSSIELYLYSYFSSIGNENIPDEVVTMATVGSKVYFGSNINGLYVYDGQKFKNLNRENDFPIEKVKKVVPISDTSLYVVSDFDDVYLVNASNNTFTQVYDSRDFIGRNIQTLTLSDSKVFVATNRGINILENEKRYLIDKEQGVESYNFTSQSVFNGNIYFGTNEGLYKITQYFENVQNDYKPQIKVYEVLINGETIDKKTNYSWFDINNPILELPFNKNNIRIYFTDWNAKFPQKIRFRYRLKQNEDWSNVLPKKEIDLNYLEPGNYNLEFLIENLSTGKFYQKEILKINIKPRFYQTWAFYILLSLFIIIVSFFVYRYRLITMQKKQQAKNEWLLMQKEIERKRIQAENDKISLEKQQVELQNRLSRTKLQALRSHMNPHFIFNALNTLQFFIVKRDREKGLQYLSKFSKLVRETLENSINDTITLADEIEYLKVYTSIENMRFEDRQIKFHFDVASDIDVSQVLVPPMISQPFVENCILHAFDESVSNPEIIFKYRKDDIYLICEIIDNGVGFNDGVAQDFNNHISRGISLVKERIELMLPDLKDALTIEHLKQGTKVQILLPYLTK